MHTDNLGFPRVGGQRELKRALESYFAGESSEQALLDAGRALCRERWRIQADAGVTQLPCGDFSFYDHMLDMAVGLGAGGPRVRLAAESLEGYFALARGSSQNPELSQDLNASARAPWEMTKWFDTNYHYLVPELAAEHGFQPRPERLLGELRQARAEARRVRPVLVGPVTFLLLSRTTTHRHALGLMDECLEAYVQLLQALSREGVTEVQIDEPCLTGDLDAHARAAYLRAFAVLARRVPEVDLWLTTYFGELEDNLALVLNLPVAGLHLDLSRHLRSRQDQNAPTEALPRELASLLSGAPEHLGVSLGVIDGRNVFRGDLHRALRLIEQAAELRPLERLRLAPSCSLQFCPIDLDLETKLTPQVKPWLAFAKQKLGELNALARGITEGREAIADEISANRVALESRQRSQLTRDPALHTRLTSLGSPRREPGTDQRRPRQRAALNLPLLPTTTIGSFPQTRELRKMRADVRRGKCSQEHYNAFLEREIARTVQKQEQLGIDVLVHGEPERTDMVEHFAQFLTGFASTEHGWVQSYGSRCVKPPIVFGTVKRVAPMTLTWAKFAQSCSERPVKGMLTGPVTILKWSFVRDDQPWEDTAREIGLALRSEVEDLQAEGIRIIQIDEPALREALPLRAHRRAAYLRWATGAFRLASSAAHATTQIHTHMCYADFGEVLAALNDLDVDVISLEAARSQHALLGELEPGQFAGELGPGVYDIHSPRIPSSADLLNLLRETLKVVQADQLWINPDCGLKTRTWEEVEPALSNMVAATRQLRIELDQQAP